MAYLRRMRNDNLVLSPSGTLAATFLVLDISRGRADLLVGRARLLPAYVE